MLQILTGRPGSGKSTHTMNEIIDNLNNKTNDSNIILFVPDQMSFQAEYEIAKRLDGKTYHRLQVLSFKKLAYYIFLEVGGITKTVVSDLAVDMILTKIIEENKERFSIYDKLSANYNFVSLVHDLIKEFKSFLVDKDLIEQMINIDETLKKKLNDVFIIFEELNKEYGNKLIDNEDFNTQLTEKIKDSSYLKNAEIYIDGYHSYTTVELKVIENLIRYSKKVTILLTMDDLKKVDMDDNDHLFHLPYKTVRKLIDFTKKAEIDWDITHFDTYHRFKNKELEFLMTTFDSNEVYHDGVDAIQIIESESPTSEVFHVARMIFNDVFKNHASYSDYVIYMNNQEVYYPLIKNAFRLFNIPVFMGDKEVMLDHSLISFLDATLEVVKTDFSYEAIFRAIKTEMFLPCETDGEKLTVKNYQRHVKDYRKQIDLLENYCLSHGIKGSNWEDEYWTYDKNKKLFDLKIKMNDENRRIEAIINQTKKEISKPMIQFKNRFKAAKTVLQQVHALYQLLESMDVLTKIEIYEKIDTMNQDLTQAKKHKQAYNKVIEMLDELVEVCQDYQIDTFLFINIIQTGLKGMKFAIVPPAIDQVMVGTLKQSRFEMMGHFDDSKSNGVKKAFVLGVNENDIPKIESDNGLITNKEREFLTQNNIELVPTIEKTFLDDFFIIYTVLCSPSEKLILSYTLSSQEKKEAFKSEIIERILEKYPKLKVKTLYDFPTDEKEELDYITAIHPTTSTLLNAMNLLRKGHPVTDFWRSLYGYYKQSDELKHKLSGVTYKNVASKLNDSDIKSCYDGQISASVSSIEKYNSCPYQHFIDKGLGIRERDIQKVEAMDIGDLYHETLKDISNHLIKENKDLHELGLPGLKNLVEHTVEVYAENMQRHYFYQNKRNLYILDKVKQSVMQSLEVMHYQSSHGEFKVLAAEERFGNHVNKLVVQPKELSTGLKMQIKGSVDRIDVAYLNDQPYIRIIDYKSGNKDIDFSKIYHKLSLQLFTYLDVVLTNSDKFLTKPAQAAGVMYYHIHQSVINADKEMSLEDINKRHREAYKMNGYTLGEPEVSILFDDKLKEGTKSDIVKVSYTKAGYYKIQAKVLDEESIRALRNFTRAAIVESSEAIANGEIDIKPVQYNKQAPCRYCKYHAICKFDPTLKENQYNIINRVGDAQVVIDIIKDEYGSDHSE